MIHLSSPASNFSYYSANGAALPQPSPIQPLAHPGKFRMTRGTDCFKGSKRFLPTKPCATCGRPMTSRKRWAKNWDVVKYCSDACRRHPVRTA